MDGAIDVQSGRISAGPKGGDGGWNEYAGSSPGCSVCTGTRCAKCWPIRSGRVIDRILEDDLGRPRKQRHTAKRIFERLRDEYGFDGQYTIVKDYVRESRRQTREMFVPLSHPPGHAQCDFGEALVVIGGIERKAHCFVLGPAPQRRVLREGLSCRDHRGIPGRARFAFAFQSAMAIARGHRE